MTTAVLGLQWGDEGKGKIVDLLSKTADFAVRFHGGNNAGHTVVIGDRRYFFHLVPSGVFSKKTIGVIANGVIIDPEVLLDEIDTLKKAGISLKKKLFISPRCHLILPYHKTLDIALEKARGKKSLGTTGRGIGPCYADKASYNGIRMYELVRFKLFEEKFAFQLRIKNKILKALGTTPVNKEKELARFRQYSKLLSPYIADAYKLLENAHADKKNILLEGAHGTMLDVDWSPYPYTTASNTVTGQVNIGTGLPVGAIDRKIGIVKAYTSRVGGGPLPTELDKQTANKIRERGGEYGTTTGRPRRVGWLDVEAVRFACTINSITEIVLTKLDVLSGVPHIKVCTGYRLGGKSIPYSTCGYEELYKVVPVYKEFLGWQEDISGIRDFKQLPKEARKYIQYIERALGVPITTISVGPERTATIRL